MNSKVSYAVAVILGSVPCAALASTPTSDSAAGDATVSASPDPQGAPATAPPTPAADAEGVAEVVVTAQRRSESMQNVPISMQAFTAETLEQLNITTFDDYVKFLPNVTTADNGPGQNEVFMRGLSAGSQASQGSGSTGLWPNVAIYLDNQSGQLPNRNLDIYAADLNRIEVLEGPQGTLFGAGAEAGAIRYITNQPNLSQTTGNVSAGYGVTAHGDPNNNVTAVLNVPLIANTFAIRAVIYDDHRGGYIDNVPATFTRNNTDMGIHYAYYPAVDGACPNGLPNTGWCVPPGSPSINNAALVGNNINPVTYQGIRVEALYQINDAWSVLITQMYQDMEAQGVFYQQPFSSDGSPLDPYEVTLFNPASDRDKFESTAWTVNGKFAQLNAVYTGGYLVRNVDQVGDYTNYARGVFADYYQCYGPGSATNPLTSTCFSPSSTWHSVERNEHLQNEVRLSTPDDWRLRAIAGAFYEDNKLYDETDWMYKTVPPCTSDGAAGTPGNTGCETNIGTFADATVQNPGIQSNNSSFYQDTMRETKQTAVFASADFDLLPKVLTVTLGTRWFRFDNSSVGSVTSTFGCFQAGAPPCLSAFSYDLNDEHLSGSESGLKSRGNLTWHITPDAMVYYTFSQGFRPGGFNQNGGSTYAPGTDGVAQYILPKSYESDKLTNNEIGWKTEFLDRRLQWNGAIYRESWDNVQIEFFDPGVTGNIFYDTNGQNFLIKGIETSLVARVTTGLTLQGAASWNESRQTNSPALIDTNPMSNNYGKPITQVCSASGTDCAPITNPFGPVGSPSADAPPMQFSLRARYEWHLGSYSPFVQVGATHNDHAFTQAGSNPTFAPGVITTSRLRFDLPAYSTYEASVGVAKDTWYATVYGQNLSNSNAATFISTDQFIEEQTPLRPRVIGVTFGYNF
ncbi:MAG TPA: TonB-dependent receptor [Steroidobacteraceae bacterium]|nr:TonB-dependent receptor [Steroidobacteraceae bacterium]